MKNFTTASEEKIQKIEAQMEEINKKFYGHSKKVNKNFGRLVLSIMLFGLLTVAEHYSFHEIYLKSNVAIIFICNLIVMGYKHSKYIALIKPLDKELLEEEIKNNKLRAVKDEPISKVSTPTG